MIDRNRLSDGDREILAALEAEARPSSEDMADLLESADRIEDVFGEMLDAAYGRDDFGGDVGEWTLPPAGPDDEIPF